MHSVYSNLWLSHADVEGSTQQKRNSCDRRPGSQTWEIQVDDVEAIKILKGRYFRFMDTKDWTAWGGLFTADATLDADTAVSTRGADPKSPYRQGPERDRQFCPELCR